MNPETEKPAVTQIRCFKDDTSRIRRLAERLEVLERAGMNTEHVITRALDVLERELQIQRKEPTQAAAV